MSSGAAQAIQPAKPAWRPVRLALAAGALATLSACATGFLYNRVDWAVSWYVDGFVSLDGRQEQMLRESVRRTMAWHRQSELGRYVALLERLAADVAAPVTVDVLEAYYQETAALLNDFLAQASPEAARLLASLDGRQVAELARNLEADNAEKWEEYAGATPALREKRRLKAATRAIQPLLGSLSVAQRRLVAERMATVQDLSDPWLERRRAWQGALLALLESSARGPEFERGVRSLLLEPEQFDGDVYRRRSEDNRRVVMGMLAELSATLTPAQREHLRKKLLEYARDLRRIAAAA